MTMDSTNFAYWLNGFAELNGDTPPTAEQWKAIREHLALVFEKVTPPVGAPTTKPLDGFRPNINPALIWPAPKTGNGPWKMPFTVEC